MATLTELKDLIDNLNAQLASNREVNITLQSRKDSLDQQITILKSKETSLRAEITDKQNKLANSMTRRNALIQKRDALLIELQEISTGVKI